MLIQAAVSLRCIAVLHCNIAGCWPCWSEAPFAAHACCPVRKASTTMGWFQTHAYLARCWTAGPDPSCCRFGDQEQNIISDNREVGATFAGAKINVH